MPRPSRQLTSLRWESRNAGQQETGLGVGTPEAVYQGQVVGRESVLQVRPVAGIGVVDAQVDDHDIPGKVHGLPELFLPHVRPVPLPQQRGAALAKIPHLVSGAQQTLKPRGIALLHPVIQLHPVSDAVTHARHFYGRQGLPGLALCRPQGQGKKQCR